VTFLIAVVDVIVDPELVEGLILVVVMVDAEDGVVVELGIEATGIATGTNLSFVNIVKPAIGILETFFNFTFAGIVFVGVEGVAVDPEPIEGFFGFGFAKGLNCEKKFVPVVPLPVWPDGLLKYKSPKTAIIMITRMIIKSIKFLFDIKI